MLTLTVLTLFYRIQSLASTFPPPPPSSVNPNLMDGLAQSREAACPVPISQAFAARLVRGSSHARVLPVIVLARTVLSECVCARSVTQLCRLFATSRAVAPQVSLFMGFSGQQDWSRLLFPSPGDLPHTGIEPKSPSSASKESSPLSHLGSPAE